jgi:hypothetical protein
MFFISYEEIAPHPYEIIEADAGLSNYRKCDNVLR